MTEIFFSYSSRDRALVQPVRDALTEYGFAVFWDQEVPTSTDWDTWIRRHLAESKCAIVVWSSNSIHSDNVRHEATIAKQQNKLVSVLIEAIGPDQFPMGLYAMQAANLSSWAGDLRHPEWLKVLREIESKLMPPWAKRSIDGLDAELVAERARRESAERRDRALREQIAKEAQGRQEMQTERDRALEDVTELKEALEAAGRERTNQSLRISELVQQLEDASRRYDSLLQQQTDTRRALVRLEDRMPHLEKQRDEALAQAGASVMRCTATEERATELDRSLRDANASVASLENRLATLASRTSEPHPAQLSAGDARSSALSAQPVTPPRTGIDDDANAINNADESGDVEREIPFAAGDHNGVAALMRFRVGAAAVGSALTLAIWAVAFQAYYPEDFLIKYNYFIALAVFVAGMVLVRGAIFDAIPLFVTWGILGSAMTLIVSASLFRLYYPDDTVIVSNYFIGAGGIGIWLLLSFKLKSRLWPPRS